METLSDKIFWHGHDDKWYLPIEDVKEFIKDLKEGFSEREWAGEDEKGKTKTEMVITISFEELDKLLGPKLT